MSFAPQNIFIPLLGLAGVVLALFVGVAVADGQYLGIGLTVAAILLIIWAIWGQDIWWMPIFFFMTLGGLFYVGFKIYSHEIAVLICLLPMVLAVAMRKSTLQSKYKNLPVVLMLLLFVYLIGHYFAVVGYHQINGLSGFGNITRRYMDAMWPLLILVPFLWVGNSSKIKWLLPLIGLATLIRFSLAFGIAQFEREELLYIPGINFVPAGGGNITDLRFSGLTLAMVAVSYLCLTRSILLRGFWLIILAVACYGTFLGGGRIIVVLLSGMFGFILLIYRNYTLLSLWGAAVLFGALVLNTFPDILYGSHDKVRRAASAFIVDREEAAEMGQTGLSDDWHARLQEAGWQSWTESVWTILFGRGTTKFEDRAWQEGENFEGMVEMATATSRFEKGLWTTLATFGLVGLILYSALLWRIMQICTPILIRDRIATPIHAIMFMAVYGCASWFLLCWIAGDFPSSQLLLGIVALAGANYWEEMRKGPPTRSKIRHFASDGLAEEHLHVPHVRKRVLGGPANHS